MKGIWDPENQQNKIEPLRPGVRNEKYGIKSSDFNKVYVVLGY